MIGEFKLRVHLVLLARILHGVSGIQGISVVDFFVF